MHRKTIGEHLAKALVQAARTDPVTEEERVLHARLVHERIWRDRRRRGIQADVFDRESS